jgi:predicted O-methyltransferase YrrM
MEILPEAVLHYAEKFTSPEDALVQEVGLFTLANHPKAHMLSGKVQGKFLEMLSCMIRPRRILEIGTFTGYSALCLAKGLAIDGQLHTLELRPDDAATALGFFNRSEHKDKIFLHIGDAAEKIGELAETWDLVFIDADKTAYATYFGLIMPKLKLNGFIFVDNTLFHGQVLEPEIRGKNAKAIQAFNEMLQQRTDVETVLLPLRDGLTLIRKIA